MNCDSYMIIVQNKSEIERPIALRSSRSWETRYQNNLWINKEQTNDQQTIISAKDQRDQFQLQEANTYPVPLKKINWNIH